MKKQKVIWAEKSAKNESGLPPSPSFPRTRESGNRDSESGKSMLEMLGVLALMGLLAVLGAKGYDIAMERVNATNIINEVNRRSVIHSQQLLAGSSLDSSELPNRMQGNYPVSSSPFGDVFFRIDVSEVTPEVCKRVGKLDFRKPVLIKANDQPLTLSDQSSCSGSANLLSFFFLKDLTSCQGCLNNLKTCVGQSGCASNQTCRNNLCVCASQYSCGATCCPAGQSCINGKCSNAQACDPSSECDGVCENGACICHSYRDCRYYCRLKSPNGTGTCSPYSYLAPGSNTGPDGVIWSTWDWDSAMTLYAAKDFCASYGKEMVNFSDLGCIKDGTLQNWKCTIPDKFKGHSWVRVDEELISSGLGWKVNTSTGEVSTHDLGYPFIALCK